MIGALYAPCANPRTPARPSQVIWSVRCCAPLGFGLEVYTQPYADGYHSRQDFSVGQEVPVVIDGAEAGRIPAADLLP
jgi:hypothetical protein